MNYESKEEVYFSWWIDELTKAGIIQDIKYQPKSFILSDKFNIKFIEHLKTKTKERSVNILADHIYTADWLIRWNKKAHLKVYASIDDELTHTIKRYPLLANHNKEKDYYFSVVDVKGTFNQNDAWRRFSIDQKWVMQKYGIYVQKIVPNPAVSKSGALKPATALFPNTFVPGRFFITDGGTRQRKINYKYLTIDEYLLSIGIQI
jgi:hypothetical protein